MPLATQGIILWISAEHQNQKPNTYPFVSVEIYEVVKIVKLVLR